jgi:hypothetical protein
MRGEQPLHIRRFLELELLKILYDTITILSLTTITCYNMDVSGYILVSRNIRIIIVVGGSIYLYTTHLF